MAADTNLEQEYKFDVEADFDPPDLRPIVGRTERLAAQLLTTTYFDTADGRLWARGATLRHRVTQQGDAAPGGPGKWTLKVPVPAEGTDAESVARSELSWTGAVDTVPEEARAILAGLVRRSPLTPVVVLSTERRRLLLHQGEPPWAELDDDLATVTSGPRDGFRFRQVELELLDDHAGGRSAVPADQLQAVLATLRGAGAAPGGESKYALAAGIEPPPARRRARDVASFATATLEDDLAELLEADYRARLADGPPGADPGETMVERLATAVERLRGDLRLLGAVLDPVWLARTRRALAALGAPLARLMEEDALVARIRAGTADGIEAEAVAELVSVIRSERHLAVGELRAALSSDRYMETLDRLQVAVRRPPLAESAAGHPSGVSLARVLRTMVTSSWRALLAELDEMAAEPDMEGLDHLRILAARFRRAVELGGPVGAGKGARAGADAAALESTLRDLAAAAGAVRILRELATHPSVTAPVAFTAGRLAGRAEREVADRGREWRKRARGFGRPA